MNTYNGFTNCETWNIACHIGKDIIWYNTAKECNNYDEFLCHMFEYLNLTPEGINPLDKCINKKELDQLIKEL